MLKRYPLSMAHFCFSFLPFSPLHVWNFPIRSSEYLISKTTLPYFCEKPSMVKLPSVDILNLNQVSMSKLFTHLPNSPMVWHDSFNRTKKWVQELQRQSMSLELNLFRQCYWKNYICLGIVSYLGLHVLNIVSCQCVGNPNLVMAFVANKTYLDSK